MTNKFGVLMNLNIRNRLAYFRSGGFRDEAGRIKPGKVFGGIFMGLVYLMLLALVVAMEFLIFEGMKAIGRPELLLSMALTLVMASMIFMSFYYVLTSLYYGRDTAFLAGLPVRSETVFGAKLTEALLGETGIAMVALLPAVILYGVYAGMGVGYYLRAALVMLTSAMMPLAILAVLTTLIVRLGGSSKHRDAVTIIYSIVVMMTVLMVEFSVMGSVPDDAGPLYLVQLMLDKKLLMQQFAQAFPPSWWAMQGLMGDWLALAGYLASAFGSYALVWFLLGRNYLSLGLTMTENSASRRKGRKAGEGRIHRPLTALFFKEWREILRTPVYAFNSLSGIIIMPLMLVGMYFGMKESAGLDGFSAMLNMINEPLSQIPREYIILVVAGIMAFVCCINPAVDTAVSREGGRHMLSRMLPVSPRMQLQAKLLMGMSINVISSVIGLVILLVLFPAYADAIVPAFLLTMVLNLAMSSFGLAIDAGHPNFHWRNETQAIKSNSNIALGMLVSVVLLVLPIAAFFLQRSLALQWRMAIAAVLCLAEAAAGYATLMLVASGRYARLEDEAA